MHLEVIFVENQQDNHLEEENIPMQEESQEGAGYQPRPLWQRIGAWVGLILFIAVLIMYYVNIMRGGL